MPLFAAIDAGGTSTRCWIANESVVLSKVTADTVKIMSVGEPVATERFQQLVREACTQASADPSQITRIGMGLAGIGGKGVREWAIASLRALTPAEVLLSGDEEIALDAAFEGGPGILVIAGTGSNIVGRCADGTLHTAGGWGPMLGDEGSGSWIGLEAIRAGLRAHDRNLDTCLLREIEAAWNLASLSELVAKSNNRPRPDFSQLARVVAECADNGDALAQSVLERAGIELADQVSLVVSKMKASGCAPADTSHVAFTGSVLAKISRVRRSMEEHLLSTMPGLDVAQSAVEPLEGALWRARRG